MNRKQQKNFSEELFKCCLSSEEQLILPGFPRPDEITEMEKKLKISLKMLTHMLKTNGACPDIVKEFRRDLVSIYKKDFLPTDTKP